MGLIFALTGINHSSDTKVTENPPKVNNLGEKELLDVWKKPTLGDLLLIRGNGVAGSWISQLDTLSLGHSHIGLVVSLNPIKILHILGNEDKSHSQIVELKNFLENTLPKPWTVLRAKNKRVAKRAVEIGVALHKGGVEYDYAFDFEDKSKLSCTELPWLVYNRALLETDNKLRVMNEFYYKLGKKWVSIGGFLNSDFFETQHQKLEE